MLRFRLFVVSSLFDAFINDENRKSDEIFREVESAGR
jgi:hypothetical protein